MINIVKDEKEIKTYIEGTRKLFELYRITLKYDMGETIFEKKFTDIVKKALTTDDYSIDTVKGKILRDNLLGDRTLSSISNETNYSVAHIYFIKHKILKEFAALTFEVVLLWVMQRWENLQKIIIK